MIIKKSFKLFLSIITILIGLTTGCLHNKGNLIEPLDQKEIEELTAGVKQLEVEVPQPTTYLIVGLPGIEVDQNKENKFLEVWLDHIQSTIKEETVISTSGNKAEPVVYTVCLKRINESDTDVEGHANEALQQIINFLDSKTIDYKDVKITMVGQVYGGLVGLRLASILKDAGINTAGLITVDTPFGGIELLNGIKSIRDSIQVWKDRLATIKLDGAVSNLEDRFLKHKGALETMYPTSSFITGVRNGGLVRNFPILALAGRDEQPTGTYDILHYLYYKLEFPLTEEGVQKLKSWEVHVPKLLLNIGGKPILNWLKPKIEPYIYPIYPVNNGLITVSSATAKEIEKTDFTSHVLRNFSHNLENETNKQEPNKGEPSEEALKKINHKEALESVKKFIIDKVAK